MAESARWRANNKRKVALSSDGAAFVNTTREKIEFRSASSGTIVKSVPYRGTLPKVVTSPDGLTVVASTAKELTIMYAPPVRTMQRMNVANAQSYRTSHVAISADGNLLATNHRGRGMVDLWDLRAMWQQANHPTEPQRAH